MYGEPWREWIEYEAILDLHIEGKIDITFIHWWTITPSVTPPSTHIDTALTPTSPNYIPASPDYSPTSDMKSDPSEDPSSDHIPLLPAISPFLLSTDDSSDSDTPDTPPSPTMLPTHRLVVRNSVDYFSSDHFALDDSLRDSSSSSLSSSSSKTSSDPSSYDLPDSSSDHSLPAPSSGMRSSHHLCSLVPSIPRSCATITNRPSHDSSSVSLSRKRSRSPAASVPLSVPTPRALTSACVDLLPSPKRIRSPESATNLEVSLAESSEPSKSRGTNLGMDDDVEKSDGLDINLEI
nr:ulp1 protease family, C-terminal catalytic domain-containing protein [Tanacetum cinerariifolium]